MDPAQLKVDDLAALDATLGYLNFSSGGSDPQLFVNLDRLYRMLGADGAGSPAAGGDPSATHAAGEATWQRLGRLISMRLEQLSSAGGTFRDAEQARSILHLTHHELLPAYCEFHRDLLFHQDDETLFNAFFVGRVYEVLLQHRSDEDVAASDESVIVSALATLNDFLGHRPVAVLETEQRIEPYPHERLRPVPLFIAGAGVACGRYERLIAGALAVLHGTDEMILQQAYFDPELLEELAFDPRPYDFSHPVNRRPNYHFGQWDPSHIDNQGRYRRFVVQQVTLEAILVRVEAGTEDQRDELFFEAAATLAGTILMSAATSGRGPETHSSEVSLASLLPGIAAVRDEFYTTLLAASVEKHPHLADDARQRQQPFGAARQQLNAELARRRAAQLEHMQLAHAFARMGYAEAAERQAAMVPAVSSQIVCQIECRLATGNLLLDRGRIDETALLFPEIVDLLHRGIACGAIVDPWNAIGFDGHFSLFPAVQDSLPDHRLDELVELMDGIFALFARTWSLAAAADNDEVQTTAGSELLKLATWWDRFAVPSVSGLDAVFAAPLHESAEKAAVALAAWKEAGTTAGDVAFWRPHVEEFDSPKAYVLVVEALLDQRDYVAAMGLLMHWLSQADRIELQEAGDWFHTLVERWLAQLLEDPNAEETEVARTEATAGAGARTSEAAVDRWALVRKFFDFLEANADEYWEAPQLELETLLGEAELGDDAELGEEDEQEGADEEGELYRAAYDEVTFRDSSDDGIDSDLLGSHEAQSDYELEYEARRLTERLTFLVTLSRLWSRTAVSLLDVEAADGELRERVDQWLARTLANRRDLLELLDDLARHRIAQPSGSFESLVEYDRRTNIKEALLERTTATCVHASAAVWMLLAAGARAPDADFAPTEVEFSALLQAALRGERDALESAWEAWTEQLREQPLLYVPINRGGDPAQVVAARAVHRSLRMMLGVLPRLGEIERTSELLQLCVSLEQAHPVGPRAVTEFADLLQTAHRSMAGAVIASVDAWQAEDVEDAEAQAERRDQDLIDALQQLTDAALVVWLAHSQHLRLSVLEKVTDAADWQQTVDFIARFGGDLFDQQFMNPGNLRSILQSGAAQWLRDAAERTEDVDELPTLALIADEEARREALRRFELVIEAVLENQAEYVDYNSTTTQSDHGDKLYTLLDLVRVRVVYDRVAWNVTPVVLTHEALVRSGHASAAALWQRELARQTSEVADELLQRLSELQRQHGMRLSTIAGRLEERFVRPLAIDRIRALVAPAVARVRQGEASPEFVALEEEVDELTRTPSGVGFEVPEWIVALEEEIDRTVAPPGTIDLERIVNAHLSPPLLSREELEDQLAGLIDEEE